jgi:hypothetical protein
MERTTLSANGQHLAVPIGTLPRNSGWGLNVEGDGMAERVLW